MLGHCLYLLCGSSMNELKVIIIRENLPVIGVLPGIPSRYIPRCLCYPRNTAYKPSFRRLDLIHGRAVISDVFCLGGDELE